MGQEQRVVRDVRTAVRTGCSQEGLSALSSRQPVRGRLFPSCRSFVRQRFHLGGVAFERGRQPALGAFTGLQIPRHARCRSAAAGFAGRSPGPAPEPCTILLRLLGGDSRWNRRVLAAVGRQSNHQGALRLSLKKTRIADLEPLAGCRSLRALDLRGTRVADVGALWSRTRLEWLDLSGTGVANLRPHNESGCTPGALSG